MFIILAFWAKVRIFLCISGYVSKIKVLFCVLAGCISPKIVCPEISPCTLLIYIVMKESVFEN